MNKRWSIDEKLELMKLYASGMSYDDIGKKINRSSNAIKLRLEQIIYNNIVKNKSIESLMKSFNTTSDNIKQMYYSHKSFKQGRGEPVIDVDFDKKTIQSNDNERIKKEVTQIDKIKYENQILEEIIKNYQLKNYVKKLYQNGKIDSIDSKIFNSFIKHDK